MSERIHILVCENYLNEARAVIATDRAFEGVSVSAFPSRCGRPPLSPEEVTTALPAPDASAEILGDSCLALLREAPAIGDRHHLHITTPCFALFMGHRQVESALQEGAYLLTPGWLAHWRERIASWGFAQDDLRTFLHETTKSLVLLDTGIDSDSALLLKAFGEYADLPCSIVPVGLDYFSRLLMIVVLERRLELQKIKADETITRLRQKSSDYAMALDLLGRFNRMKDEEETIRLILDIFDMLLAPKELIYLCFEEGKPLHAHSLRAATCRPDQATIRRIADFQGNHAWNDPGGGLFRVALGDETLGIVIVDRITFPEYRQHYLDLALTILLPICALSINNARNYQDLKRTEQALLNLNEELEQRVHERTAELERNNAQLTQMNRFLVNRELRMIDLKEKIRKLEGRPGEPQDNQI